MIRNYLKIALRNLVKNKVFSFINITGLAVGMAVSLLILLYVSHEMSYDKFHPNASRIYQVSESFKFDGQTMNTTGLHESFGGIVKKNIPEIENFARFKSVYGEKVLKSDFEHRFKETNLYVADPSVFQIFGFKLKSGDAKTALADPKQIILTERLAQKYFGSKNPLGQTITFDTKYPLTVTGIIENPPSNTMFQFDALISFSTIPTIDEMKDIYERAGAWDTYLVLNSEKSKESVEKKIKLATKDIGFGINAETTFNLESVPTLHLNNGTSQQYLYIFLTVAFLILFLAIINYVSLTTARASQRAKEVGVRKVSGGNRSELAFQFFLESFLITSLAFVLAVILLKILIPIALNLLNIKIDNNFSQNPIFVAISVALFLTCGLASGIFPALILSKFSPYQVLKGQFNSGRSGSFIRQFFTVFQFAVSIALIVCSLLVISQLSFIRNKEIGLKKDQVLVIPMDKTIAKNLMSFKQEIRQQTAVQNLSVVDAPLFKTDNSPMMFYATMKESKQEFGLHLMNVDENFFETMGVKWQLSPQNWTGKVQKNGLNVFNEMAMKKINWQNYKIGQKMPFMLGDLDNAALEGVVKDFNFTTLHEEIKPLMISVMSDTAKNIANFSGDSYLFVRLNTKADLPQNVANIQKIYQKYQPNIPFDYYFMDEAFNRLYKTEDRMARMFGIFTAIAIFIACLGLFGLVTFTAEQKTKEIGIRKVLGASVSNIVSLLSKNLIRLVLIANVIAFPIAYYLTDKWLQDFAFKTKIDWSIFLVSGVSALIIALLTVSYQAIRAALMNPVKSLKTE